MADIISALTVYDVEIPALATHSHGIGDVSSIHSVIVEITTENGVIGWGEASPWPAFSGTTEACIGAIVQHFRPLLLGQDPMHQRSLMAKMSRAVVGVTEAKAAIETALLDIAGKITGQSVSEVLGGRCRNALPYSFSIANPRFDEDLALMDEFVDSGHRLFKVKTGFAGHDFDIMRLQAISERFGDRIDLRVDYNQGLRPDEAKRYLPDLNAFKLAFIEQPVAARHVNVIAGLRTLINAPLLVDESVFSLSDAAEVVEAAAADLISLKIMKHGGLRAALSIADFAMARGCGVYGGCMFETGIAHMAGVHLCAVLPELPFGCEFYMANHYLEEDILDTPFPAANGLITVPETPGLGIDVDRDRLLARTLQQWS